MEWLCDVNREAVFLYIGFIVRIRIWQIIPVGERKDYAK